MVYINNDNNNNNNNKHTQAWEEKEKSKAYFRSCTVLKCTRDFYLRRLRSTYKITFSAC